MASFPSSYARRSLDDDLDELLHDLPAIALEGPKGVGKTATLLRRATSVFSLDEQSVERAVGDNPSVVTSAEKPVFIDEWQRVPRVWNDVKRAVDQGTGPGSFLLAGSAAPPQDATIHSGAGRIVALHLRPMALFERDLATPTVSLGTLLATSHADIEGSVSGFGIDRYATEITRSGFPGMRVLEGRGRALALRGYARLILDRDLPDVGLLVRHRKTLEAWMRSYAAAVSTTTEYGKLLDAATAGHSEKPAKSTTLAYREALESIFIVEPVPGWAPADNALTRLRQGPKHQLCDPALAATMLGLGPESLLRSALLGPLFESLATLTVRVAASRHDADVYHLRTYNGNREVDLIVEGPDGSVVAIEVKAADSCRDDDVRHLLWLREKLGERLVNAVVVTAGTHAYRRPDGVAVVPLALLKP